MDSPINWQAATFWVTTGGFTLAIATMLVKFGTIQEMISSHARTLIEHRTKMDQHDALLLKLIGELQHVIGRIETSRSFEDGYRRHEDRKPR